MRRVTCVVGARPNYMKAAPVIRALKTYPDVVVSLIHTGQHYDPQMSHLFFEELQMPTPDVDLQVGSGPHGHQTGLILMRLEPLLMEQTPDVVVVFGDVNTTMAASVCASKLGIPVAHVEAGLRSFDRGMPEELNRIITDHLADVLFTTEASGKANLLREGIPSNMIFFVGNVMVDTLLQHRDRAAAVRYSERFGVSVQAYALLTLHRPSNVDHPDTLLGIMNAIHTLSCEVPVIFPCHPRTQRMLQRDRGDFLIDNARGARVHIVEPLPYLEFLSLMIDARVVLTDSGGIQEETTVLGVPCLTLRDSTERPVTVEQGTNTLVGNDPDRICEAVRQTLHHPPKGNRVPELWDGSAADRIAAVLMRADWASTAPASRDRPTWSTDPQPAISSDPLGRSSGVGWGTASNT